MADILYVDFQRKALIGKKQIVPDLPSSNLEKLAHFSKLIDRGLTMVVANSNVANTKLPPHLAGNPAVEISWSHKFGLSDFVYDDFKIAGTLSFDQRNFHVELPWESVWLIFRPDEGDDSIKIWAEDSPEGTPQEVVDNEEEIS
jgi:hypothetical protein